MCTLYFFLVYRARLPRNMIEQEFLRFFLNGLAEDLSRRRLGSSDSGIGARGGGASSAAQIPGAISDEALSRLPADQQAARAWASHVVRNDSEVTSMFCGQLQSRICCLTCGNISYCFDPFFDLSVPLPGPCRRRSFTSSKGSNVGGSVGSSGGGRGVGGHRTANGVSGTGGQSSSACTLEDCLQAFSKEEILDGDNRPICSACRKRRKSEKSLSVHRFPPVLVVHLKRFQYDSSSRDKIGTSVDFPITALDLSPYSTSGASVSSQCDQGRLHRGSASSEENPMRNYPGTGQDFKGDVAGRGGREREGNSQRRRILRHPPMYELYGVCNHMGGLEGGHYTAHCRHNGPSFGSTDTTGSGNVEWNTFDDARVSRVNPVRMGGSAAYVLFYRLVQREAGSDK